MKLYFEIIIFFLLSHLLFSCNKSSFSGGSKEKVAKTTASVEQIVVTTAEEPVPEATQTIDSEPQKVTPIRNYKNRVFWVVTTSNHAYYVKLNDTKQEVALTKHWTFSGGGCGIRTYVSEAGLVFGRCGGGGPFIYVIDPENTPVETNIEPSWSSGGSGSRACIASYKKGEKRFIGFGWNGGTSGRMFTEVPMTDNPPYKIDFTQAKDYDAGTGAWAYNCNIDQPNLIYYGAQGYAVPIYGFDLKQMKEIDPAKTIKNAGFVSKNLTATDISDPGSKTGDGIFPYSISGDFYGNVFTGYSYTYAYTEDYTNEKLPKMVWRSSRHLFAPYNGDGKMSVYPHECFYKRETCENYKTYTPEEYGATGLHIGPMGSIGQGEVIGISRGASRAFLYKLKDATDASSGITTVDLKTNFVGDAYMYTDFTGSTLYIVNVLSKFNLFDIPHFKKKVPINALSFTYTPQNDNADTSGIIAKARCYLRGDENLPDFEEVGSLADGLSNIPIKVDSCQGYFEIVEITLNNSRGIFNPNEQNDIQIKISQDIK